MRFWELYRTVSKRRWMILGLLAVTLVGVHLSTVNQVPHYVAAVQIMPSDAALYKPILPSPAAVAAGMGEQRSESQLPNLMSLIKSRQVAERAINLAGLQDNPDMLLKRISVGTAVNPGARSRQEVGTDIIELRVKDPDARRAVKTANSIAHVFATYYQEISHQEAADNRRFLESEVAIAKRNLEQASGSLKAFKQSCGITSLPDETASAMASVKQATAECDMARASLAECQAKLSEVDNQLRRVGPTRTVQEGSSNTPVVQELEAQLARLTSQLNDAKSKYEDAHPTVVSLKQAIHEVQGKLTKERGRIQTSTSVVRNPVYEALLQERAKLAYERDGLSARVGQLQAAASRASGKIKPGMDVNLARLENELQLAQTSYNNVVGQLNQARVSEKEMSATGAIRLVDPAVRAEGPIGTNRKLYVAFGAILSLLMGIGLAVTLDALDNRIRTNRDVEALLSLPVTAVIPGSLGPHESSLARVTHVDPLSPIAEAYRFLRTDLLLSAAATGAKTIMVVTAKPGQGGTTTLANLGISLAMDGKRVILVDADMRRPSLHRVFKAPNEAGLSNVLCNEMDYADVLAGTEVDNLLLIPAGPSPSNPSELLGSARMRSLAGALAEHADFVLFDTPSAIAFADSVVLSQIVDGVILVVRANQVARGAELQVRNLLNKAHANIIGVVLNDVQPDMVDSYYYYSHYYPDVKSRSRWSLQNAETAPSLPPTSEQE